jgi:hypothetical protein
MAALALHASARDPVVGEKAKMRIAAPTYGAPDLALKAGVEEA